MAEEQIRRERNEYHPYDGFRCWGWENELMKLLTYSHNPQAWFSGTMSLKGSITVW